MSFWLNNETPIKGEIREKLHRRDYLPLVVAGPIDTIGLKVAS